MQQPIMFLWEGGGWRQRLRLYAQAGGGGGYGGDGGDEGAIPAPASLLLAPP